MKPLWVAGGVLILLNVLADDIPAPAKILKTKRPEEFKALALTIGSGFEFETDNEQTEYDYPFLVEYGFTEALTVTVEPNYVHVKRKDGASVSGFGDLETSATYEFIRERRHRPSVSVEGLIKWPTAARDEFGTGKTDYSVGAVVSKEFIRANLDFNAVYTFVGNPPGETFGDILELSMAMEWHLSSILDLEGEVVSSFGGGGSSGKPGSIGGFGAPGGRETEGTLGMAELLGERLKLEEGFIIKSDGSWQAVAAWEWDFGEGK